VAGREPGSILYVAWWLGSAWRSGWAGLCLLGGMKGILLHGYSRDMRAGDGYLYRVYDDAMVLVSSGEHFLL